MPDRVSPQPHRPDPSQPPPSTPAGASAPGQAFLTSCPNYSELLSLLSLRAAPTCSLLARRDLGNSSFCHDFRQKANPAPGLLVCS